MADGTHLIDLFIARFGGEVSALPQLGEAIVDLSRRAAQAWPDQRMPQEDFIEAVATRLDTDTDPILTLAQMRAGDMYIAQACAAGHADAIAVCESTYMPVVVTKIRSMRAGSDESDEVAQQIRERLLVGGAGRGPRIADYAGRGDLRRWLRATATRNFLNLKRKSKREVAVGDESVLDAMASSAVDPELALLKRKYGAEFKASFYEALARLTSRQKTLLRYQHVDGLSVDKIAAIYNVHRATLHRWLAGARDAVAQRTERGLRERLSITDTEFQSIRRLVQSQLHLSISRVLGGDGEGDDDESDSGDSGA